MNKRKEIYRISNYRWLLREKTYNIASNWENAN